MSASVSTDSSLTGSETERGMKVSSFANNAITAGLVSWSNKVSCGAGDKWWSVREERGERSARRARGKQTAVVVGKGRWSYTMYVVEGRWRWSE